MKSICFLGLTIAGGYFAFSDSFYFEVPKGSVGVIYDRVNNKYEPREYGEGKYFVNPLTQKAEIINFGYRPIKVTSLIPATDKIMCEITYEGEFKPNEKRILTILNSYGPIFDQAFVPALINSVLKAEVKQYSSQEMIQKKQEVESKIVEDIEKKGKELHFEFQHGKISKWEVFNGGNTQDSNPQSQ